MAGLIGVLVLLYVRRTEEPAGDLPAREFERQLDILSGEYPILRDEAEQSESDRPSYGDAKAEGTDPGDEMEPPEQGRRRA